MYLISVEKIVLMKLPHISAYFLRGCFSDNSPGKIQVLKDDSSHLVKSHLF